MVFFGYAITYIVKMMKVSSCLIQEGKTLTKKSYFFYKSPRVNVPAPVEYSQVFESRKKS